MGVVDVPDIPNLTRAASLIFVGTVVRVNDSTVSMVAPSARLAVVRVDRGLRVDPALGDLGGHLITVSVAEGEAPSVGDHAVFFTRSWLHGDGVAVHEIARADAGHEQAVAAAVEALPDMHLQDRLTEADLVVVGDVTRTHRVKDQRLERRAPLWALASIRVASVLKGSPESDEVALAYPTSVAREWYRAPRPKRGERAIFILQRDDAEARPWRRELGETAGAYTALEPSDVQPEERADDIRRLLEAN
jgi:hypothetical protein